MLFVGWVKPGKTVRFRASTQLAIIAVLIKTHILKGEPNK
jgi:hypothetical protein